MGNAAANHAVPASRLMLGALVANLANQGSIPVVMDHVYVAPVVRLVKNRVQHAVRVVVEANNPTELHENASPVHQAHSVMILMCVKSVSQAHSHPEKDRSVATSVDVAQRATQLPLLANVVCLASTLMMVTVCHVRLMSSLHNLVLVNVTIVTAAFNRPPMAPDVNRALLARLLILVDVNHVIMMNTPKTTPVNVSDVEKVPKSTHHRQAVNCANPDFSVMMTTIVSCVHLILLLLMRELTCARCVLLAKLLTLLELLVIK